MILFELIHGAGFHVFSRKPRDWIREVESCGAILIDCFGQEYFFLDRLFVRLAQTVSGRRGKDTGQLQALSVDSSSAENSLTRRLYWHLRRIIVPFSVWIEPLFANIFPPSFATHAIFVFQKRL